MEETYLPQRGGSSVDGLGSDWAADWTLLINREEDHSDCVGDEVVAVCGRLRSGYRCCRGCCYSSGD